MFKSPSAVPLSWFVSLSSEHQSGKMESLFSNIRLNSSKHEACESAPAYLVALSLIDIIPLLVGQQVITRLLWITFRSKKIDILNCNLALFHNLQYLISILHLIVLCSQPLAQKIILKFLFVYVQIGGPMSLSFICLERYAAVIHPMSYPLLKKYRFREICAVTVWLFSVPTALGSVLAEESLSSLKETLLDIFPICVLVVMTAMMVRCSVSIARTLKKSGPGRGELHPTKRRAFKTVCATSAITFFCYAPVTLMQRFKFEDEYTYYCIITPVCILFLSAASVVHPLFYLSAQGKFKSTCLK